MAAFRDRSLAENAFVGVLRSRTRPAIPTTRLRRWAAARDECCAADPNPQAGRPRGRERAQHADASVRSPCACPGRSARRATAHAHAPALERALGAEGGKRRAAGSDHAGWRPIGSGVHCPPRFSRRSGGFATSTAGSVCATGAGVGRRASSPRRPLGARPRR